MCFWWRPLEGGAEWHVVQVVPGLFQVIVAAFPPGKLPWQYVDAQVRFAAFQAGAAPPATARPPNWSVGLPFRCVVDAAVEVGTGWHSAHWIGAVRPDGLFTCAWCAPTTSEDPLPCVSVGGAAWTRGSAPATAARDGSPWQEVQAASPWPTFVQVGVWFVPPALRVAPWQ